MANTPSNKFMLEIGDRQKYVVVTTSEGTEIDYEPTQEEIEYIRQTREFMATSMTSMLFHSRSALEEFTLPDETKEVRVIHPPVPSRNATVCSYIEFPDETAAPAITDATGRKFYPSNVVTPYHWPCAGDCVVNTNVDYTAYHLQAYSGTDDTIPFLEMFAFALKYDRDVFLPKGNYIVNAEIPVSDFNMTMYGEGPTNSSIMSNALDGHMIRNYNSGCEFKNFSLVGLPSRYNQNAKNDSNGLHCEDVENEDNGSRLLISNVFAIYQPGIGVYAQTAASDLNRVYANRNKSHGICIDGGQSVGRSDLLFKGWNNLTLCRTEHNGGHGYAIGHPDAVPGNSVYRINIDNCEGHNNAWDDTVRYADTCNYVVAEQVYITTSAAGGEDIRGGWTIGGRHIGIEYCRSLQCTVPYHIVNTGFNTDDITIRKCRVIGDDVVAVALDENITPEMSIDIDFSWMANVSNAVAVEDRVKVRHLIEGDKEYRYGYLYEDDWSDFTPADITTNGGTPTINPNASNIFRKCQRGKTIKFTIDGSFGFTQNDASGEIYLELGQALGVTWNTAMDQTFNVGRVFGISSTSALFAETISDDRIRLVSNDTASGGVASVVTVDDIVGSSIQLTLSGSVEIA